MAQGVTAVVRTLSRRTFNLAIVLACLLIGASSSRISSAEPPAIQLDRTLFSWRVPIAYRKTVDSRLVFEGEVISEEDAKGLPLVSIFIGVALLVHLVDAVLALQREIRYGGILIDTRGTEIDIRNDKRLDAGLIVIVSDAGVRLYERSELVDPDDLVRALKK